MEVLKKYWFVLLVGLLGVGAIGYYVYDQSKDVVPGKSVDGKDIVYSIGDKNVTADEFYDDMFEEVSAEGIFMFVQKAVLEAVVETTDEMKTQAATDAATVITQFQSQYGTEYKSVLTSILRQYGYNDYNDLEAFMLLSARSSVYEDTLFSDKFDELKPRLLSHILVSMEDSNNPTAEELAIMSEIDAALAAGTDFGDVAYQYSDDSSYESYGYLGYSDVNTSYVPEFLAASLALNEGEMSDWVKTDYGYHLIFCDASTYETLSMSEDYYSGIRSNNSTMIVQNIWNKAVELGLTFADPTVETKVKNYIGLGGNE